MLRPAYPQSPPESPCSAPGSGIVAGDSKSPALFIAVFVDGLRSAEPPMKVGTRGAKALITSPEALRVEIGFAPGSQVGRSLSQPSGSLLSQANLSAAAGSGCSNSEARKTRCHAASFSAPR